MAKKYNNGYLFISASISLILVAFFIVLTKDKTDKILHPPHPKMMTENNLCITLIGSGTSIEIDNIDKTIELLKRNEDVNLGDLFSEKTLKTIENTAICLGNAPLEISAFSLLKKTQEISVLNPFQVIKKINTSLVRATSGSTLFRNLNFTLTAKINLEKNDYN